MCQRTEVTTNGIWDTSGEPQAIEYSKTITCVEKMAENDREVTLRSEKGGSDVVRSYILS